MANNLIPEELNVLIQQYLTDGVLTDKERQVILNIAETMGLDRDEIDIFLETEAAARRLKGKTCPYCGGSPLLTDKCPHCGEKVTLEACNELQEIFDKLEEALVNLMSGIDFARSKATIERYSRKAKMYYGNNPRVQKLLDEIEEESKKADEKFRVPIYDRIKYAIIVLLLLTLAFYTFFIPFIFKGFRNYLNSCWNKVFGKV